MRCNEITNKIEDRYPKQYAMEWDNVGLLVGRCDKEVQKIYIALDATDEVIEDAVNWGADLLVTHHPMIFKGMKRITNQDFIGRRVLKLIQNDISYYAMHTNYDVKGMAQLAGEYLEMEEMEVLEETAKEDGIMDGIGRVGILKSEITLQDCCQFGKKALGLPNVKGFGDVNQMVRRAAISPGSGKSVISCAMKKGADVLITGDIDHHEGIDAVAQGMMIIDAGHYGTEYIYMEDMRKFCEANFPEIQVRTAKVQQPFQIL